MITNRTKLVIASLAIMGALITAASRAQQATDESVSQGESAAQTTKESKNKGSFWMDQKLRFSKEILTGLAKADFDAIGKNAELMRGLNRIEAFVRREPEGYKDQLRLFNFANRSLIRSAQQENLEGVTLAFNQMTVSCVSCHKQLRESAARHSK